MKKAYVLMRVLAFQDNTTVRIPAGCFSDKEDAMKASEAFTGSLKGLTPEAAQLFKYVGIVGFGGVVVEQDFTLGSGLVGVERPALIAPNGAPLKG